MSDIVAGKYVSTKKLQVVKALSTIAAKNPQTGAVERVYGSWATEQNNLIVFEPDKPVVLSAELVKLPHIQQLIQNGILKRVY